MITNGHTDCTPHQQGLYAEIQDEIKDAEVKAGAVVMESGSQRRAQETLLRKLLLAQRRGFERGDCYS